MCQSLSFSGKFLNMHEAPKIHLTNSAPTFLFRNNHVGYYQFYANNIFFYWATNANCIRRMLATAGQDVDFNSIVL